MFVFSSIWRALCGFHVSKLKFSYIYVNAHYPLYSSLSRRFYPIMPPKRKVAAAKTEAPKEKQSKEVEDKVPESDAVTKKRNRAVKNAEPPQTKTAKIVQSEEKDDPPEVPKETSKRGKRQPPKVAKPVEEESDEGEEAEPVTKQPKGKLGKPEPAASKTLLNQTETTYTNISFACEKTNKLGKTSNFCIASWNVDGLRAWVKKDGLTYIENEKPDVFCIQESKCSTEKLPAEVTNLKEYKQYWHNSAKDGYAGVGLFSRSEPISVKYGIEDVDQDEEGRCITAEFDKFYVVSVYVPNAGRKLVTLPKRLEWNILFKKFIKGLNADKPVIICGDMNVAHSEIDLANPKTNTKNAGFTKEEREGMTNFLEDGYVDTFRSFYPDKKDAYTFWSYMAKARPKNVGWRLDYFIISERLLDNVCDNIIRDKVFGSDHCPISLFLNI